MAEFKRVPQKFLATGLDLLHPPDLMPEGKFPILQNVRVNQQGALTVRQSLTNVSGSALDQLPLHSVRRLNNSLPLFPAGGVALLPYTRVVGSGTKLYTGATSLTVADTGYSGNPLSLIPSQPFGGQDAWMYVADSTKYRKVRGDVAVTNYAIGIAPPTSPPSLAYGVPFFDNITTGGVAFTASGTAGAVTTPTRFSTTIAAILYDTGTTGWACVIPTTMDATFQPGCYVLTNASEVVIAREVFEAIKSTTISSIKYDSGSSGACTIVLTANSSGLQPNAIIRIAAAEYVRVLSVTTGPDDAATSFRCVTTGTRAAGDAVAGQRSYRAYHIGTFAAANTITSSANQSTIALGTGILTLAGAIDLSTIGSRPTMPDDYIHISIYTDNPANVVEGKFMLDIDPTTNDFTKNYLYKAFRASDLQTNVSNLLTVPSAQQVAVQRQILGDNTLTPPINPTQPTNDVFDPGSGVPSDGGQGVNTDGEAPPSSVQQVTGSGQWSEIKIKVAELVRVGSDRSRSLANVASLRVQLQVSASTILAFGSWWIGGAFGRDIGQTGSPILYSYRYRSSVTGAVSNPSPVPRSGLNPQREQVNITYSASADSQVDQIELFSFGAGLDEWHKVAQFTNGNGTYADTIDTISIATNPPLQFDRYQPFPSTDIPRAGTCSTFGTAITTTTGDTFNTSWAPGSAIIVGGIVTTVYSVPSSSLLFLTDSVGTGSSTAFSLPGATIQGQPLAAMWGPYGGTDTGLYNFAVGDINDPGLLYWTNANDPDSASDKGFKSVTSPSEPLMNGFTVDGRNILFSSDRVFNVVQSLSGPNQFTTQEMINGTGLFARWAFCYKGTKFWYLSKSGIYQGSLDSIDPLQPITDQDLYPLFPHDGAAPPNSPLNGLYYPPDFTVTAKLRLSADEDSVYFEYQDTQAVQRCLRYDLFYKGWFPYDFTPQPLTIYKEEGSGVESVLAGGNDGILYSLAIGTADGSLATAISCRVRTRALDYGDTRSRKYFGDLMLDADTQSVTVTSELGYNNFTETPDFNQTFLSGSRTQTVLDIQRGAGYLARNIAVDLSWSSATALPVLYEWQPSVIEKPELSLRRATDWDDAGHPGLKHIRAMLVESDTLGVERTVAVLGDGGSATGNPSVLITTAGQTLLPYALSPFTAHNLKLLPSDSDQWQLFRVLWIYDPYPEFSTITGAFTNAGYVGDKFVQGIRLKANTNSAPVNFQIQGDGGVVMTTIQGSHNGEEVVPYSWLPFTAHLLRVVPLGPASVWDYPESEWVWEPMPDQALHWVTQGTSHDLTGWQPLRDFYIPLISFTPSTFVITADGVRTAQFIIPSTFGVYKKVYINQMNFNSGTWPLKGKVFDYSLTSTGIGTRLFIKDIEVWVRQWGMQGPFVAKQPFGDLSRSNGGARI